jgi:hypothetical protein
VIGRNQVAALVARYVETLSDTGKKPSLERCRRFVRDNGVTGHRDWVDEEYGKLFPNSRRSRLQKLERFRHSTPSNS